MKDKILTLCSRLRFGILGGALLVAASSLILHRVTAAQGGEKSPPLKLSIESTPVKGDIQIRATFAPVIKKIAPSVVNVFTTTTIRRNPDFQSILDDPIFRRFFQGRPGIDVPSNGPETQQGLGSGAIISEDGYILTNNHVVDGADEVEVGLSDGRVFTAKVVGADPETEVALLKIAATGLPYLKIADSDQVEVGDLVLALGNPFGVGQSVTMGMVSATGRGVGLDTEDFIQTDAAINPGNSGGPLVDVDGRLIGVNTLIVSRSGGSQGIGFAIPSNLAASIVKSLVENGRVIRALIGVRLQELTPVLAEQLGVKNGSGGVVIAEVFTGSAAERAGIEAGDIITEFGGKAVKDPRHLKALVGEAGPGQAIAMKVMRDGQAKTITVTPIEKGGTETVVRKERRAAPTQEHLAGVTLADLNRATRARFNIPPNVTGAIITAIDSNSVAYKAKLRVGDVIEQIDRKPIRTAQEAVDLTDKLTKNQFLLRVWSANGSRFVPIDESQQR